MCSRSQMCNVFFSVLFLKGRYIIFERIFSQSVSYVFIEDLGWLCKAVSSTPVNRCKIIRMVFPSYTGLFQYRKRHNFVKHCKGYWSSVKVVSILGFIFICTVLYIMKLLEEEIYLVKNDNEQEKNHKFQAICFF